MQRRHLRLLTLPLSLLAALGLLAVPAQAASSIPSSAHYVAMGDSFSSGFGTPNITGTCGRSPQGYPTLWANAHGITSFTDVTCAGAVSDDVLTKQIPALSRDTDVVTITIGGNDVGFGPVVLTCLTGDQPCADAINQRAKNMAQYLTRIDATYTAIRRAAPKAKVYVLGYPHLFESTAVCISPFSLSQTQRKLINQGTDLLDDNLAQHATQAGFRFVDVRQAFAGHGDCSPLSWILPLLSSAGLHPTIDGYRFGYLPALTAVTG